METMTDQKPQQQPPDETDEQLWAEMAAEEEGKEKAKEAPADHQFAEKPEKDNDAPAEGAAPAQDAAPKQDAPDIWENAPPDLKAAHDAQVRALESATNEHARRSIEGRITAYTRRLKERNDAAAQQPATAKEEAADTLGELAAEYPEIAEPLKKTLAPITEKLSQFDAQMRSRQEAADQQMDAELKANEQLLERQHPGWDSYLREHGAAFGAWIVDQPLYLRQAFITNQEAILDPYSAIETLGAFKQFVASNQPPPQQVAPQPAAAQTQRLNPRRAAQLAGSASPQSAGTRPTVSGIPEDGDPQMLWNGFRDIDPDEKKWRSA
jgi:hypothetical protein